MLFSMAGTFIPEWSLTIFILNMVLILMGAVLSAYWFKEVSDQRTFDRLTSLIMFLLTGFFLITPILRLFSDTAAFWLFVMSYLLFIMNFLSKSMLLSPGQRGKLRFIPGIAIAIFIIGFFLRDNGESIISQVYSKHQAALVLGTILALCGYVFTLVAGTFIKGTVRSR